MKLILFICFFCVTIISCQKDDTVTIGYQLMANPWKSLIASGELDNIDGKKVEFKRFTSGAKVINAMASGDVDIAVSGSTPIASALSQGVNLKLIWIMEVIGDSEGLVVREDINTLADLKGKKVAVPYGSTTHYHLMIALQEAGIKNDKIKILNMTPSGIAASWKKNDIDAAFVWAPALEEIKQTGKLLLSSKTLAEKGYPTFDGIIARNGFIKKNPKFVKAFLKKINTLHENMNKNPWTKESSQVKQIADFLGTNISDVMTSLQGYTFPGKEKQNLTQISSSLKKTSAFLLEQGKISKVKDSYAKYIWNEFIKE